MNFYRIEAYKAFVKSGIKSDEAFNLQARKDIKSNEGRIEYVLDKGASNNKRFYFKNKNYSSDLKKQISKGKMFLLYLFLVIVLFALVVFLQENDILSNEIGIIIAVPIILVFMYSFFGFVMSLISFPKALILQNGFLYEKTLFNNKSNAHFFDEIVLSKSDKSKYLYFKRKGFFIEKSLILYSELGNEKLETFFQEYISMTDDIQLSNFE